MGSAGNIPSGGSGSRPVGGDDGSRSRAGARRKRAGLANLQYIRLGRFFVILATKGKHRFYEKEAGNIRDIRATPLRIGGYSISYRRGGRTRSGHPDPKWHAHVRIDRERYLELKAHFLELATRRSAQELALAFYELPFEPYAPVRRQVLKLLRAVNRTRRLAGLLPVPTLALPLRRRVVAPYGFSVVRVHSDRHGQM